jgi:hypothetical protein
MTELNFPSESEDAAAKVSAELLAGAVVVGVIARRRQIGTLLA